MRKDFDVVVAGAGFAGCLAARDMARAGLKVGLFDVNREGVPHRPIIIEVERSIFQKVGIPFPRYEDIPYHTDALRVFSTSGREVFKVAGGDLAPLPVYQDRLVAYLLESAVASGAHYFPDHLAVRPLLHGKKVVGSAFKQDGNGSIHDVRASLTIDATGFNATLVNMMPPEAGFDFPSGEEHVVAAENAFHEVDSVKASDAVMRGLHGDRELWTRFGKYGPYSTVFSYLSTTEKRAYILVGYKKNHPGTPALNETLDTFRNEQGYYGKKLHGGPGLIRIHHSLDRLVSDGFAVAGESACMVIPVHGSGAASALYAASLLAKTAVSAVNSGNVSVQALWPYAAEYQRTRGRILASLDLSRLFVEKLTSEQVGLLLENSIMSREEFISGGYPRIPDISATALFKKIIGIVKIPELAVGLIGMGWSTIKILKHYEMFPVFYNEDVFKRWRKKKADHLNRFTRY
jgi:flavin-dependent dehydrogenase